MKIIEPTLQNYIDTLTKNNQVHINIHYMLPITETLSFFDIALQNRSHTKPYCQYIKSQDNNLQACMCNKRKSIEKALSIREPYIGTCYKGITEIVYPIIYNKVAVCVLYIGNLVNTTNPSIDSEALSPGIIESLEYMTSSQLEEYTTLAGIIADVIRKHLEQSSISLTCRPGSQTHWAIRQALDHIAINYRYDITLSDVASLCFLNEQYLSRLFKKEIGSTFSAHLNAHRLEMSKALLTSTQDTVLAIATAVGFNNVTYYNRCFRHAYGIAPGQYRDNHINN